MNIMIIDQKLIFKKNYDYLNKNDHLQINSGNYNAQSNFMDKKNKELPDNRRMNQRK